ncbi:MAG TPA: hypothetical protein VKR38_15515 [Usitatibacter sp.]|nr:hypothetical protein [Usitatibacter sp.]
MEFEKRHPEYASVAELVRKANAERSIYLAHLIAELVDRVGNAFKGLGRAVLDTEREWHELQTESFAKHAAKRY